MTNALHLPKRCVVLTFDDAVSNHATHVAPLLRRYGMGATFYVCEFPDFADNQRQYMTWAQIAELAQQGFEIGNHTWRHTAVHALDAEGLREELAYIEAQCQSYAMPAPVTFCYPGCATDPRAFPVLREQGYRLARIGGDRPYRPASDDPLLVPSYAVHGENPAVFYEALTHAQDGQVVVLMFHGVPDYDHPWVTTDPALFDTYIEHLHTQGYSVLAMRDLIPFLPS